MKITILGCGASQGVPSLESGWGKCDPNNSKNYRTRSSILIEQNNSTLLVDMSPDLRYQLLCCNENKKIDAVFFTHSHYDHINGINELRPIFLHNNRMLHVYSTEKVLSQIMQSFSYLFHNDSSPYIYKSYIKHHFIHNEFSVGNLHATCFEQNHGYTSSLGLRINNFAYSTDIASMSEENVNSLLGIDTWIVDCLSFSEPKPTHAHLELVLQWIDQVKPRQAFLTHMDNSMDYETLLSVLPENVKPAFDQMVVNLD